MHKNKQIKQKKKQYCTQLIKGTNDNHTLYQVCLKAQIPEIPEYISEEMFSEQTIYRQKEPWDKKYIKQFHQIIINCY